MRLMGAQKLGVHYFTFHDRDIAPEGATLAETNRNLDAVRRTSVLCISLISHIWREGMHA